MIPDFEEENRTYYYFFDYDLMILIEMQREKVHQIFEVNKADDNPVPTMLPRLLLGK